MGYPYQAGEFVSVGSTEGCWSRSCAFSAKPVSDYGEMAVAGPRAHGLAHRTPSTLCSQLNAAQAVSAPGQPEVCLGAGGWVTPLVMGVCGRGHQATAGCHIPGPPCWGGRGWGF